jgi:uncharacterized tellurite resistance protein B-like protein
MSVTDITEAESILLALVAKADKQIVHEESEAAERLMYRAGDDDAHAHWINALTRTNEAQAAIDLFLAQPEGKRVLLIADLWELAIADFVVDRRENDLIYAIAALLNVPAYPKGAKPLPVMDKAN